MRTFNKITIVAFGLMAAALFAAGFWNGIHFLYAGMSAVLAAVAFVDNRSIMDKITDHTIECSSS